MSLKFIINFKSVKLDVPNAISMIHMVRRVFFPLAVSRYTQLDSNDLSTVSPQVNTVDS